MTVRDAAECAGVSMSAVSMVLNGKGTGKFPEKTCFQVIDACNELGYIRFLSSESAEVDDKTLRPSRRHDRTCIMYIW